MYDAIPVLNSLSIIFYLLLLTKLINLSFLLINYLLKTTLLKTLKNQSKFLNIAIYE